MSTKIFTKESFIQLGIFVFLVAICIPVILPYFHKGYFPTQDGEWAVVRAGEMFREIRDLQIPPRYSTVLNYGFGYPLFNFTYPLPYYLATILHFFKFGFIDSIKFLFASSVILSAIFMYLGSKTFWKSITSGIVSAVFYVYLPYRLVDLYVRGSLGESISFVLFALIFWCIAQLLENPKSKIFTLLAAISYAGVILAHNIMAVYFSIFLGVFIAGLLLTGKKQAVFAMLKFIIVGVGLSCFFWFPALFEKNMILLSKIPISDRSRYFIILPQFIFPSWGYGDPATPGGFTYQLGLPQLISFIAGVVVLFYTYFKSKKLFYSFSYQIATLFVCLSLVAFFMMFSASAIFWRLPFLKEINFPWTFLGLLGFTVSLFAGFLGTFRKIRFAAVLIAVASIILFLPYAKPQSFNARDDNYYLTNDATTTASSELMPLWVKDFPTQRPADKAQFILGKGSIVVVSSTSKQLQFNANASSASAVQINTIYYPGWKISVDGAPVVPTYSNPKGIMDISMPPGNHTVAAKFTETTPRLASDIVSVAFLLAVIGWFLSENKIWKRK